jgi:Tfp pilus assembly protein FimT
MKSGFSLIELIVVVGIIITLSIFASPPLIQWLNRNKIKNFAYDLSKDINYARNISIKDGKRVVVAIVKSNSQPKNWTGQSDIDPVYYLVYEDNNSNANFDDGDKIIAYSRNAANINISSNNINKTCMNNEGKCIVFFPVGLPLMGGIVSPSIKIKGKNYENIEYDVKLMGVTGMSEVEFQK